MSDYSKTIYWAADSTVQYNSILTYPQTGMGQVLSLFLKPDIRVANHAKNGRSTKSFLDQLRLVPIYDEIARGDFLFIQFGHNDEKISDPERYTNPDREYQENLEKFVNAARTKGAHPVLITPLTRRCYMEEHKLGPGEHRPYVEAMKAVAKRLQVPLIDLYSMSRELLEQAGASQTEQWYMHLAPNTYAAYPDGKNDNTHLQYAGAVRFASCIARGLKELGGIYEALLLEDIRW